MSDFITPGDLSNGASVESWRDRLRVAEYVSPTGKSFALKYSEVSRSFNLRGTVYEFPGVDDAFVQRTGFGPRQYPWRVLFSGRDHDRNALAFEAALIEPGVGRLEHPLYGTIPRVVPYGTVTRREDLVGAAESSIVEVTFWTTTGTAYPQVVPSGASEISTALAGFGVAAGEDLAAHTFLTDAVDKAGALATARDFLTKISGAMQGVSDRVQSARDVFEDYMTVLDRGIDVTIGQPLLLADQVLNLILAPARALIGVSDRMDGYALMAESIITSAAGTPSTALEAGSAIPIRFRKIINDLRLADLVVSGSVAGSATAAASQDYATRSEALAAADALATQFDGYATWRDDAFSDVAAMDTNAGQVDTGEAYQALLESVALLLGQLVQKSFELKPERSLVLGRDRTIIDLCSQLYGGVDDYLDLMINSNRLVGDEILLIPKGREIVYYPEI